MFFNTLAVNDAQTHMVNTDVLFFFFCLWAKTSGAEARILRGYGGKSKPVQINCVSLMVALSMSLRPKKCLLGLRIE